MQQVKTGFTNYQPQLKYFMAFSEIEEKTNKTIIIEKRKISVNSPNQP